jgi:DnaA family protein
MLPMKQLPLDIRPLPAPGLAQIVAGPNAEALDALRALVGGRLAEPVYLWGGAQAGKSLLLAAAAEALDVSCLAGHDVAWPATPGAIVLDSVHLLSGPAQIEAFDHFNRNRSAGLAWLAGGNDAPAALPLRQDLRTRLGWGLIYQLKPLSDEDKRLAMQQYAAARGFDLPATVSDYLLTRHSRDLGHLLAVIEALDRFSLVTQRPVTLPLLKTLLPQA